MKSLVLKVVSMLFVLVFISACTINQVGTSSSSSAWGAGMGGAAGAQLGHELSKK